jgi:proline iminopeptidase
MKFFHLMPARTALLVGLAAALSSAVIDAAVTEQPAAADGRSFSRSEVTAIIAAVRKVVSGKGVEELIEIPVGGTKQWISVRGADRGNPILLMIHGGPASPDIPTSWAFQRGWEDYFTVVQWDQRGSGKTYNANDPKTIQPTLSADRITQDAAEVVQYLRTKYGKDKIFVLGHSWGTVVGLQLARRHPEWLYAYIGMGQIISGKENERVGYQLTLAAARAAGNTQAVTELTAIAPYPEADGSVPLAKIDQERKWSVNYGGLTWGRTNLDYYSDLAELSPDYTQADVDAIDKGSRLSLGPLLPELTAFDYTAVTEWHCPIIIFAGRHDFTTPSSVAAAWLERVHAPAKKLVWFENSAHMMMIEEPGRMLVHLVEDVRPLAK